MNVTRKQSAIKSFAHNNTIWKHLVMVDEKGGVPTATASIWNAHSGLVKRAVSDGGGSGTGRAAVLLA